MGCGEGSEGSGVEEGAASTYCMFLSPFTHIRPICIVVVGCCVVLASFFLFFFHSSFTNGSFFTPPVQGKQPLSKFFERPAILKGRLFLCVFSTTVGLLLTRVTINLQKTS